MPLSPASHDWAASVMGSAPKDLIVVPLTPDMGERVYFRVRSPQGQSYVLCQYPKSVSKELPFFRVQDFLTAQGFDVPKTVAIHESLGVVLEEDLGDVALSKTDPHVHVEAILQILCRLSRIDLKTLPSDSSILTYSLDKNLFMRELQHTAHWLLGDMGKLGDQDQRRFLSLMDGLLADVDGCPRVVCHRDFHVNNIFYHQNKYYLIDFQDMRQGFGGYDLFSFLFEREGAMGRDDQFMESRIRLISQYRNQSYYNDMMDDRSFYRAFAKNGLQRCLKALGNFARNRKVYEAYIPLSLRSLKHTMALLAEYDARSADKVSELRTLLSPLFSQAP